MSIKISNPDKIYWPEEKITKKELLNYYQDIAGVMLPYISDRPVSLNRFPDGINGKNFFQKDVSNLHLPEFTATKVIYDVKYLICNNLQTLLFIANLGSIEINTWLSKIDSLENPDWLLIDLDPEDIDFKYVVRSALEFKKIFDQYKIPAFVKTSGKTGLHIIIPLGAKYNYDIVKRFARILVTRVNNLIPGFTSIIRQPSKRQKKVYLDFLQNEHGQTLAAPYSVRPVRGALVSAPLLWQEVNEKLRPEHYSIKNMRHRIVEVGDPWKPLLKHKGIELEKILKEIR